MTESQDWRTRRWEATHQRIYDTAMASFQEHGFEAVSVGQIASGAGVSVPTFYAHYPSKEHVVMGMPTTEEIRALVAGTPADLPLAARIRQAIPGWLATWTPEFRAANLRRWRIIAGTPSLRTRAAEFERATAGMIADAVPSRSRPPVQPAEKIVLDAHLAAYTAALLAWADSDGERELEHCMDEAFGALDPR